MKLERNNLFFGIIGFLLLVNILVLADLNAFYIRAILAFIFIVTVPGLLIMLCFKIRSIGFWEYFVYTVGLSISFIMFAGLAVNWTLPALGITDKPLALLPIVTCFNIFLIILWLVAFIRNKDLKLEIKPLKLDTTNRIFFIIPMLFPVLSILGAFILNNGGPNYLTMIMLGGIAVYVFMLYMFHKRLSENTIMFGICLISLSLLYMLSLRSWYLSGWDSYQEQFVYKLTDNHGYWSISNLKDSYNSCLSITILPLILRVFVSISDQYVFKALYSLLFCLTPVVLFLFLRVMFSRKIVILSVLLFISQIGFFEMSFLNRQQAAFFFLIVSLFVLFSKSGASNSKKTISAIFIFSMVVSHYSTAYLTIALLVFAYLSSSIFKNRGDNRATYLKIISLSFVLLTILFVFLWHSQITSSGNDLVSVVKSTVENIPQIYNEEAHAEGTALFDRINIFYKPSSFEPVLKSYTQEVTDQSSNNTSFIKYDSSSYANYYPHIIYPDFINFKINRQVINYIYLSESILRLIIKLFLLLGIIFLIFSSKNRKEISSEYISLCLAAFMLVFASAILPIVSISYPTERLYQQSLIFLSPVVIFGAFKVAEIIKLKSFGELFLVLTICLLFLFSSGFVQQIIGGASSSLQLNSFGDQYNQAYAHKSEMCSVLWLSENRDYSYPLTADKYAARRVYSFSQSSVQSDDLLPQVIDKRSYVYADYDNIIEKSTAKIYLGRDLTFNFPEEFLNTNKNIVYSNGESRIYK